MTPIRVLIVDDHAILRMGLASLLASKSEIEVVGDASDGPSGIRKALKLKPDVEVEKNNRNRVMRSIERIHDGDHATPGKEKRYDSLRLGVSWPREVVNQRIDERLERRLQEGMIEEVQKLMDEGATTEFLLGLGLEYRFITQYLIGEIPDKSVMLDKLAIAIKQFAKRQMTWFRRNPDIVWLDMSGDFFDQACSAVDAFLKEE